MPSPTGSTLPVLASTLAMDGSELAQTASADELTSLLTEAGSAMAASDGPSPGPRLSATWAGAEAEAESRTRPSGPTSLAVALTVALPAAEASPEAVAPPARPDTTSGSEHSHSNSTELPSGAPWDDALAANEALSPT